MANLSDMEHSKVLLLLEEYCSRRFQQRSPRVIQCQALSHPKGPTPTVVTTGRVIAALSGPLRRKSNTTQPKNVAERLVEINEMAPIPDMPLVDQDELIQKLVELMTTFGDNINKKIDQNPVLQLHLSNLTYDMFEKLTSSVQSLILMGMTPGPEEQIQQQRISWAFEVTSRLSAISVVQQRRVLSYGNQYIQQHHSDWIQQHGGWEKVFDVD